jgi:hypothetical protein
LLAVAPESVQPQKPKVLIFGPAGVGKTWTALNFPNVFYCDHEGGADLDHYREKLKRSNGGYFGPEQGSLDFETVIGQVQALATETHPYKTIVFDSITKLFNNAISEESERIIAKGNKDEFGASKKGPVRQMAQLLRWTNRADMNAIFIAHETALWGLNDKGQREQVGVTFDAWPKLEYELHFVLRISKIGMGENAKRFAHVGKSRLTGFPEGSRFDWSYDEFAERYGRDVIEKQVQAVVLASPEQVGEVKRLLEIVKLPEGTTEKWFKAASVESWDEMDAEKIEKCIATLKEKLS